MAEADESRDSERDYLNDEMQPVSRLTASRQPPYDPREAVEQFGLTSPAEIVAYFTGRLLAGDLSDYKQQVLTDYLAAGSNVFDPGAPDAERRLHTLVQLICSTPEYQLN